MDNKKLKGIEQFIRATFNTKAPIGLHEPKFIGREKEYLNQCIDSTFVSYVGEFVGKFEQSLSEFTGSKYVVATANGTLALHLALLVAGVEAGDEVLTQGLSFVATANSIAYCKANIVFLDVDRETFGLSYVILKDFLEKNAEVKNGICYNKNSKNKIKACVPVHVFGHPISALDKMAKLCREFHIKLIEDAAESLGSFYKNKHTGTFGDLATLSFNGNKIVTTGGGGAVLTNDQNIYEKVKHLSTTAKVPHRWEFFHDQVGYNYRMPNVNAAVGLAQMECLPSFLQDKRELTEKYATFFRDLGICFFTEKEDVRSNYWLNSLILEDKAERDQMLTFLNDLGIMCRPIWQPLYTLPAFKEAKHGSSLENVALLADRVVNIPSSVRI